MSNDDEVGYKNPPKETQFKKGQSGNPNGRPKGTKNLKTDLTEELAEKLQLAENGKSITISKQRAVLKSLMAKAVKGDTRAIHILVGMIERLLSEEDPRESQPLAQEDQEILALYLKRNHHPERESDDE